MRDWGMPVRFGVWRARREPADHMERGDARWRRGDFAGARSAYLSAVDSGDPQIVPKAQWRVGVACKHLGDLTGAVDALRRAAESGDPEFAPLGEFSLGGVFSLRADQAKAAAVGGVDEAHRADLAQAAEAYQRAAASDHPDVAPKAMLCLAEIREDQDDPAEATDAYQRAIDSGDPDVSAKALYGLGRLRAREGDVSGAESAYRRALDSGHPEVVGLARQGIDDLRPGLRAEEKVECVIILCRQTRATREECAAIVDLVCRGQDVAGARVVSYTTGADTTESMAQTMVYMRESEGEISAGALERSRFVEIESNGDRRIVAVVAAPPAVRSAQ
jgi:tetratricopeptide (TPR) repeat protein